MLDKHPRDWNRGDWAYALFCLAVIAAGLLAIN